MAFLPLVNRHFDMVMITMKNTAHRIFLTLIFLCLSVLPCNGAVQENANIETAQQELTAVSSADLENASLEDIESYMVRIRSLVDYGKTCVGNYQQELDQLDKAIATLGETAEGEMKEITQEREGLQTIKKQKEADLAKCRLLELRALEHEQQLYKYKKKVFARDLFAKGPNLYEIIKSKEVRSPAWMKTLQNYYFTNSGIKQLISWVIIPLLLLTGLGLFAGFRLDNVFHRYEGTIKDEGVFFDILRGIGTRTSTFTLPGGLIGLMAGMLYFLPDTEPAYYLPSLIGSLLLAFVLFIGGKIFIRTVERKEGGEQLIFTHSAIICLYFLAFFSGLLCFTLASSISAVLPEEPFFLLRAAVVVLWYSTLLWFLWQLCQHTKLSNWRRVSRLMLVLLLGAGILAELTGFRTFAVHLLTGITGTLVLFFLLTFANRVVSEVISGLGKGKYLWQKTIRNYLGIKQNDVLKGIIWTSSIIKLLFFLIFIYGILRLWGISRVYSSSFSDWLVDGFTIGKVSIVPSRIGIGFLFFSIGWTVVSLLKDKVIRSWLAESELAPSLQDALTTLFGYIGFSIVILIALSTAGIDFSGLAIIVGALSVGIGFGLQNIVNNLISGLILLFERPIKRGDWIVVGNTEGYVKKISVRSTIIQTFDRSDVIVPNSELISNQVTNMMLLDVRGRVRVPVGVAYGSNTELVKQILLDVANKHPEVITNGTSPLPVVRFQGFGESSLDFELFCHLRDVDKRLDVRSDMHFAIDKAFRNQGVEIPFPQRDLHFKDKPAQNKCPAPDDQDEAD